MATVKNTWHEEKKNDTSIDDVDNGTLFHEADWPNEDGVVYMKIKPIIVGKIRHDYLDLETGVTNKWDKDRAVYILTSGSTVTLQQD